MLHKGVYKDAFVLHDDSLEDPYEKEELERITAETGAEQCETGNKDLGGKEDSRQILHDTWTKWCKYQPIMKIRRYFGSKIALYFAWTGTLISSLWIPSLFGLVCFFYGLHER